MQGIMGCSEAISTDTKFKSRLNLKNSYYIYTHYIFFYSTTIPICYSVLSPNLHGKHNKSFAILELESQIITR